MRSAMGFTGAGIAAVVTVAALWAATGVSSRAVAYAQTVPTAAPASPALDPLRPDEIEALRPIARRGAAVLVRNVDSGRDARITVVVRSSAPLQTVHDVIATPEQYPSFMTGITNLQVLSRFQRRIAFRFHVAVSIFDVTTLASLHVVNAQRIDGELLQSDLGPGGLRWDLYPDGDGTLIAYTTWGDPSQANWFLRVLARVSPSTIAGMQLGYDVLLALAAGRRAEIVVGSRLPARPRDRFAATGEIEPPAPGAWTWLTRDAVVGAIALDAAGTITQSTVAMWSATPPPALCARLERIDQYTRWWTPMRDVRVVSGVGLTQRFHSVVDTVLFRTEGDQDRVVDVGPFGPRVVWRGVAGDYRGDVQRWDVVAHPQGGSVVMLSGGAEYNRTGMIARALLDRDTWMMPGYSVALKMVFMRGLVR